MRARFAISAGTDPIFRPLDGATCPTDDVSTLNAKRRAYKLLRDKGLVRVGLPMPSEPNLEFSVASVDDPYSCTTNPATGLTSPTTGIVSMYRRSLPSTNLGFLTAIMWDGREQSLAQQSIDATLIHAQASAAPTEDQQKQIVAFDQGPHAGQTFVVTDPRRDLISGKCADIGKVKGPSCADWRRAHGTFTTAPRRRSQTRLIFTTSGSASNSPNGRSRI